jgi:hypothetical protein
VVRGLEPVQCDTPHHHHEPGREVLDLLDPLHGEPGERVPDDVLCLDGIGEDPERDRDQVGAVVAPCGRDPVGGAHDREDDPSIGGVTSPGHPFGVGLATPVCSAHVAAAEVSFDAPASRCRIRPTWFVPWVLAADDRRHGDRRGSETIRQGANVMLDTTLWIAQIFLALFFFAAGVPKVIGRESSVGSASTTCPAPSS